MSADLGTVEIEFEGLEEDSDDWNGIDNFEIEKFSRKLYSRAKKILGKEFGKSNANPKINEGLNLYRCYKVVIEEGAIVRAYFQKVIS